MGEYVPDLEDIAHIEWGLFRCEKCGLDFTYREDKVEDNQAECTFCKGKCQRLEEDEDD